MANICMLLAGVASLAAGYTGPDLPPGPYCGITGECCRNRQDSCAHRILDSLCYCDEFCDLNRSHHDCCPDYLPVCRNESLPLPPQTTYLHRYRGKRFLSGQTRTDNCNGCIGIVNRNDNNVVDGVGNRITNGIGNSIMSGNSNRLVNSNNNRIDSGNGNSFMNSNNNIIKSGNGNSIENGNGNSITSGNGNRIVDTDGFTIESGNGIVVVNGNVRR